MPCPFSAACQSTSGYPPDAAAAHAAQFERNLLPCVKPVVLPIDSGTHQQAISIRGAGVAIPHPEKVKDGKRGVNLRSSGFAGEDAYFYTPGSRDMFGMGVADGVYMWREHGIDAGVFARTLMDTAQHLVEAGYSDVVRIAEICQRKVWHQLHVLQFKLDPIQIVRCTSVDRLLLAGRAHVRGTTSGA